MTIVNIQSNEQEKKEAEQTYKIGQYYLLRDENECVLECCVLAQVDSGAIALVGLQSGNRWSEPVHVGSGVSDNISEEDFTQCLGYSYNVTTTLIKSVAISYEL